MRVPSSSAAVGLALVLVSAASGAGADPPNGRPRPPKDAAEARETISRRLEAVGEEARKRGDELAAQTVAAVGVHFGRKDPTTPVVGKAPPKDDAWLDSALASVARAAASLAGQTRSEDVVAGQVVRQLPETVRALRVLNRYRTGAGVPAVRLDALRCAGPILHSRYLIRNGYEATIKRLGTTHDERETDAFYSVEGRASALAANIGQTSLSAGVERCIHTYYHRPILLEPAERSFAMGWWKEGAKEVYCLEPCSDLDPELKGPTTVCFPAPDSTEVSLAFADGGERPEPVPSVSSAQMGMPVTVTFYAGVTVVTDAGIELVDRKTPVAGYLSTPEHPSNPAANVRFQRVTCGFLPAKPLRPKTTYEVRAKASLDGKPWQKTWRFTTGASPAAPR